MSHLEFCMNIAIACAPRKYFEVKFRTQVLL